MDKIDQRQYLPGQFNFSRTLPNPPHPPHLADLFDGLQALEERGEEVGEDGQQVDDVHDALHELPVVGTGDEPDDKLQGEPRHVDRLQHVDDVVGI